MSRPATITAMIDKLERLGHVDRERSLVDRRQTMIVLTDKGREALERAPDALQQRFASEFDALADWEQAMIVAVLERVARCWPPNLTTGAQSSIRATFSFRKAFERAPSAGRLHCCRHGDWKASFILQTLTFGGRGLVNITEPGYAVLWER